MRFNHVVVDGSNIATEGRSLPSLAQLDEAVQEFQREFPGVEIIVVVDASFGHRIEEPEREVFEEAEAAGDLVSPPAGAIGRGDAFLLRIAERTGATVLSNDSFQEFHGEHEWLFDEDRLIGGKPVPGVGWIFTPRTPVRGPKSRVAVRDAKRSLVRVGSKEASQPMPVPKVPPPVRSRAAAADGAGGSALAAATADADAGKEAEEADVATRRPRRRSSRKPAAVSEAIAEATQEVVEPDAPRPGRRRRRGAPPAQAINTPLAFITFIAEHPLGTVLEGEVESFTSHGAFVTIGETHAYVPLSGLGQPPPRRARDVLARGQRRPFLVQALDPPRRGIELALPEFAHVSGQPSEETVEAEIEGQAGHDPGTSGTAGAQDGAVGEDGPIGGGGLVGEGGAVGEGATRPPAPRRRTRRKAAVVGQPAGTADASPEDAGTEDAGTVPEQSHQARTRGGGPTAKLSTSTTDDPGSPTPPAPKRRPRKKAVTGDTPDVAAASGISTEAVGNEPTERQDSAGQDSAGQDSAGQDSAGQDSAGQDSAGQDSAGQDSAGQDDTAPTAPPTAPAPKRRTRKKVAPETQAPETQAPETQAPETRAITASQSPTGHQDSAGQESAGQDSAGQDSAGQDSAGQDSAGRDDTAPTAPPTAPAPKRRTRKKAVQSVEAVEAALPAEPAVAEKPTAEKPTAEGPPGLVGVEQAPRPAPKRRVRKAAVAPASVSPEPGVPAAVEQTPATEQGGATPPPAPKRRTRKRVTTTAGVPEDGEGS